ncbi:hypothetical protein ACDF64_12600 [Agromyces sp. MMS24-JH15]|uniref:hypothetical protein n=1 Tax=Agromyces sp. MMS24-JH15 TaxID=3243765 RepID=UPI003749A54B
MSNDEAADGDESGAIGADAIGDDPIDDDAIDVAGALDGIEGRPLAERAGGYQELADRLREALEHSDPSRGDG